MVLYKFYSIRNTNNFRNLDQSLDVKYNFFKNEKIPEKKIRIELVNILITNVKSAIRVTAFLRNLRPGTKKLTALKQYDPSHWFVVNSLFFYELHPRVDCENNVIFLSRVGGMKRPFLSTFRLMYSKNLSHQSLLIKTATLSLIFRKFYCKSCMKLNKNLICIVLLIYQTILTALFKIYSLIRPDTNIHIKLQIVSSPSHT